MDVKLSPASPIAPGMDGRVRISSKSADAATQFEGLLIAQLLRASHEEGSGWLGSGEDATSGQAMAIAEEFLAQALASKGGLGIARMVNTSLAKSEEKPQPDTAKTSPQRPL
jgi:Rod binding domain-containing protein